MREKTENINTFHFGENWRNYLKNYFSIDTLNASKRRLIEFLEISSLNGKTFIDLGSGSGLHSLAALELGALRAVSVDVDKEAVACVEQLKSKSSFKQKWQVEEGSLLDADFLSSLGFFDIVYCWGVAHHTGNMWQALLNISKNVKSGGMLFIAIYNKVEGRRGSKMWWYIKHFYNKSPYLIKKIMEYSYMFYNFVILILKFKNPFKVMRLYKNKRGMSWKIDLIDWLGGYPYEYASVKEIFDFYKKEGFELQNIKTTNYIGCNQFLFLKKK